MSRVGSDTAGLLLLLLLLPALQLYNNGTQRRTVTDAADLLQTLSAALHMPQQQLQHTLLVGTTHALTRTLAA
jgi:hypothetical protein